MRWRSRIRRKMMMLRRKTDPKTGKHTLSRACVPFCVEIDRKNGRGHLRGQRFVRACSVETRMGISQEPFCMFFFGKNGPGHLRGQRFVRACAIETHMDILCRNLQDKCRTPRRPPRLNTGP